eukprot:6995726-Prymnesium_polylepis.1
MHTNGERRCSPAAPTAWAQPHALAQHAKHFAPAPPWSEHRCASSGRPLASCRATTPVLRPPLQWRWAVRTGLKAQGGGRDCNERLHDAPRWCTVHIREGSIDLIAEGCARHTMSPLEAHTPSCNRREDQEGVVALTAVP